jgi:Flp pilus assembly protein TadG
MSRLLRHFRDERGQSIIVIAVLSVVFVGLLALVLDVGSWYRDQRKARNVADASALAGLGGLPIKATAASLANTYAANNGGTLVDPSPCTGTIVNNVCFPPDGVTVQVRSRVNLHTFISNAFGAPGIPDNARQRATARLIATTQVNKARPFVFSYANKYLSGSFCGHPGVPCTGPSYVGTFSLGSSGEEDEGSSPDGFGLACLNAAQCPTVGGGDIGLRGGSTSSASISEEEGGVNCLRSVWTSWVKDGYPGTLSIPGQYPRCSGGEEPRATFKCDGTVSTGGVTLTQKSIWNYNKSTENCKNKDAVNSLYRASGCASDPTNLEIYVLVVGPHGHDDIGTLGAEEEEGGKYNAIAWASFCVTGPVPKFGGTGSSAVNQISGYFDAVDAGGPIVGCTDGPTGCFYGVGTAALQ